MTDRTMLYMEATTPYGRTAPTITGTSAYPSTLGVQKFQLPGGVKNGGRYDIPMQAKKYKPEVRKDYPTGITKTGAATPLARYAGTTVLSGGYRAIPTIGTNWLGR